MLCFLSTILLLNSAPQWTPNTFCWTFDNLNPRKNLIREVGGGNIQTYKKTYKKRSTSCNYILLAHLYVALLSEISITIRGSGVWHFAEHIGRVFQNSIWIQNALNQKEIKLQSWGPHLFHYLLYICLHQVTRVLPCTGQFRALTIW